MGNIMTENTTKKQSSHGFAKGRSGNPMGRPKGALNKATIAVQGLLDGEAETLTRKVVDLALDGNLVALKLCLERICPPRKERPLSFDLPQINNASDLPVLTASILAAVANGKLDTGQASALSSLISSHAKALEIADLEQRLLALEEQKR